MPTAVENYIFNELPRRVVIDPSIPTGSSFTAAWLLAATGVGTQAIPIDPDTLGFEPAVTPPGTDPGIKFWNGNKDWVEISAAAIGAIPTSEKGQPLGVATLDADGYVELSQMNPAVIERVVVVADEAARYALTTAQVQNGDVVNQQSPLPGTMWYVVDDTNLDNSAGYLPFSAGVAASVAWSGITGKPAIIGDLENIALADEGDVIQYVAGEWVNVDPATLKTSLSISISDVASLQDELDLKQSQSTVLDNLSAISTPGIVVRTVDGDFIGRELVGINGIEVAEADGNGDNPTISLTDTGVTAGTYGNEYEHPVVEVDSYGRVVSITEASSSNKEVVYILDQPTTALAGNTRHIFGGGVVTYSSNILLELPENVPGGTWVKILCAQNFSEASGTIGISATNPTTVQGTSLFDYTAFFKLYPFTVIDLVYSSSTNNWTLTTNATSFLSSLYVARQGATDGVSNSHAIISNATSPRSLNIPDRDVDLSSVGQTDFLDTAFRVSDNTDSTKKIAFEASAISTGQTRTISCPNFDVSLSPIRRRIKTSGTGLENLLLDNTETYIETTGETTTTIIIPVYPPYTSNAGASGYLFNATNVAKTIRFQHTWSGEISSFVGTCNHFFPETNETGGYTSTVPGSSGNTYTDIQLLPGETLRFVVSGTKTLFTVNIYRNSSNVMYENTFKIKRSALESHGVRFETSAVTTDKVITVPNADVDLGFVGPATKVYTSGVAYAVGELVYHQNHIWRVLVAHTGAIPFVNGNLELVGDTFQIHVNGPSSYTCPRLGVVSGSAKVDKSLFVDFSTSAGFTVDISEAPFRVVIRNTGSFTKLLTVSKTATGTVSFYDDQNNIITTTTSGTTSTCAIPLAAYSHVEILNYSSVAYVNLTKQNIIGKFKLRDVSAGESVGARDDGWLFAGTATAARTITLPDADVDLALVGKSTFSDAFFRIQDNGDATKQIAFEASGIATATTRTVTMPNANVNLSALAGLHQSAGLKTVTKQLFTTFEANAAGAQYLTTTGNPMSFGLTDDPLQTIPAPDNYNLGRPVLVNVKLIGYSLGSQANGTLIMERRIIFGRGTENGNTIYGGVPIVEDVSTFAFGQFAGAVFNCATGENSNTLQGQRVLLMTVALPSHNTSAEVVVVRAIAETVYAEDSIPASWL